MTSGRVLHAVGTFFQKEIVTSATRSAAGFLKDPLVVDWKDTGGRTPVNKNTTRITPRANTPVQTGAGTYVPPINIGIQNIEGPRRPIIPQEVRNSKLINASINIIPADHRDPTPSWTKVIWTTEEQNVHLGNVLDVDLKIT